MLSLCPQAFLPPTPITPTVGYQPTNQQGGTLVYANWQFPASTSPWFASTLVDREVEDALWGSPLILRPDGKMLPDELMEIPTTANGDVSPDGRTVTLNLRHDLMWSDGQPLTAGDFVYWLEVLRTPGSGVASTYGFDQLASYTAPDRYTLVLSYQQPFGSYLYYLPRAAPQHAWGLIPVTKLAKTISVNLAPQVTSGPFQVSSFANGQSITMIPRKYYVSTYFHLSLLDTLIFKTYASKDALISAYQAGQVNQAEGFTLADLLRLRQSTGLDLGPNLAYEHLGFNLQHPALQDVQVRQAIAASINRCLIIQQVFVESCNLLQVNTVLPSPDPDYSPGIISTPYSSQARQTMLNAGWDCSSGTCMKNGAAFPTLNLAMQAGDIQLQNAANMIQQNLAALGISITISPYETSDADASHPAALEQGNFDLALFSYAFSPDSDVSLSAYFQSSQIPSAANPNGGNYERISDAQLDGWLSQAHSTVDTSARRSFYLQVQERLLRQVYFVPLYLLPTLTLTNKTIANYYQNPFTVSDGSNAWNIGEWYDSNQTPL
jgi:peptide/nickel transport system substrate-binding protein